MNRDMKTTFRELDNIITNNTDQLFDIDKLRNEMNRLNNNPSKEKKECLPTGFAHNT